MVHFSFKMNSTCRRRNNVTVVFAKVLKMNPSSMSLLNNFPDVIRLNIFLVDLFYIFIFYLAAPIRIIPGNRYEPASSLS